MSHSEEAGMVRLSPAEVLTAGMGGLMRSVKRRAARSAYKYGQAGSYGDDVLGAIGEMAVAKYLGVYWAANPGDPDRGDVGRFQIRCTHHPSGRLIVHQEDPNDLIAVLVIVQGLAARIPGWIPVAEAKQQQWWDDPQKGRPAYFVPQTALRDPSGLRELV